MLKRLPLAILVLGASSAWAQQVISAHSGVIHFVEGQVTLDGQAVQPKFAEFPDVKNGQTLAAQDGRAEVLLTPGVILRLGENSSFKMISNSRADTRLELLTGETVIEVGELLPSNAITLVSGATHMELIKKGLYRLEAEDPGKFRVYEGEARVTNGEQSVLARKGRQVLIGAVLDMSAFEVKDMDALMRWAERRSEYLAQANVSSARTASNLGYSGVNGLLGGMGPGTGSWAYNPWYGMFTYMPYGNSLFYNPFGYAFYSPSNIGYFTPTMGTSGSAFPIQSASSSPHYNNGSGFAPRPSVGSSGSSAAAAAAASQSSFGSGSSSSMSSGRSSGGSIGGGGAGATSGRGK
jgi:hypothetical protein